MNRKKKRVLAQLRADTLKQRLFDKLFSDDNCMSSGEIRFLYFLRLDRGIH